MSSESAWCLIGNLGGLRRSGPSGCDGHGTSQFSHGAKLYCLPPTWGDGYQYAQVIGRSRGGRWVAMTMATKRITNWRAKVVRDPVIVRMLTGEKSRAVVVVPWTKEKAEAYAHDLHVLELKRLTGVSEQRLFAEALS